MWVNDYGINFDDNLYTAIDGLNMSLKAISDCLMFWQFIKLLRYFLNIRNERSRNLGIETTGFSKFIIAWTIFLFLFCIYQTLTFIQTFIVRIIEKDYLNSSTWRFYVSFLFYIVFPLRDFLIASSFAYLYLYQGTKQRKQENPDLRDKNREFNT
jgi:hypothetical protein